MTTVLPVTLVVIAHNEAKRIGRCLDSVPFAAEKIVVDSGSTDGYTELRALDWRDRGRRESLWACPFVFAATFFKDYFLRLAFLDGARGYVIAQTAASYAVYKRLRYYELGVNPASLDLAHQLLRQHDD